MAVTPKTFIGLDKVSSICTTRQPANVLTGIFTTLLQEHFANVENLQYNGSNEFARMSGTAHKKELENYIWNDDNTLTRIQIQPVWDYNTQNIQQKPALYVKRNTYRPERIALNDGWTANSLHDANGKVQQVRGEFHSVMIVGSHTIFCASEEGAEAELLSAEVFEFLSSFAPKLREDFKLHRLNVIEVGELAVTEDEDAVFIVPVVIGYAFATAWRIDQVAPWLKTISIDLKG